MNIGELFIVLGLKGSEKTNKELGRTKGALGEVKSMALGMKAALFGSAYALEKLFDASGKMGTGLTNFNALTGLSAQQLQKWQYAARQAGVANEDLEGSLKGVQNSMTNMLLGKGAPEGLAMLANHNKDFDIKRVRDTFYVMQQLQKFAMTTPADVGGAALKTFGLSEGVIAGMRRGAFNAKNLGGAPTYSDQEVANLDKANIAWSNLGNKIAMAVGKFNAAHGGQLVNDITKVVDAVLLLADALTKAAEALKAFEVFGKTMSLAADFLGGTSVGAKGMSTDQFKAAYSGGGRLGMAYTKSPLGGSMAAAYGRPNVPATVGAPAGSTQNIKIDQSLHFQHDGKDHKKTGDSVKKATQGAFRQYNQGQAS